MSGRLVIKVAGIPAPQGSKRHVGRGVMVESSKRVAPWREAVRTSAEQAIHHFGWARVADAQPVSVQVTFFFDRPGSHPKNRETWPTTRSSGDIDKLLRSTFDALTDAGCFKDDSQITTVLCMKRWSTPEHLPGASVIVIRNDA